MCLCVKKGVSTTTLIDRLIDAYKYHHRKDELGSEFESDISVPSNDINSKPWSNMIFDGNIITNKVSSSWSSFLASSHRIAAFSNKKTPKKSDTVIYIDGSFDLFHIGHIAALKV